VAGGIDERLQVHAVFVVLAGEVEPVVVPAKAIDRDQRAV